MTLTECGEGHFVVSSASGYLFTHSLQSVYIVAGMSHILQNCLILSTTQTLNLCGFMA
jgi:hypothetical protein